MRNHGSNCGCGCQQSPVIHPTKYNCEHHCTESVVEHIHPTHTTVMNHHLVKNKHVFPHSTSVKNTCDSVDECGGSSNGPGNQVGGEMDPGMGHGNHHQHGHNHNNKCNCNNHHNHQHNNNCNCNNQGPKRWNKPNRWW